MGLDPSSQRVGYLSHHYFPNGGIDESLHRSLTAISHWLYRGRGVGNHSFNAILNSLGYLESSEVSLETLRGNDNLHSITPYR